MLYDWHSYLVLAGAVIMFGAALYLARNLNRPWK